MSRSILCPDCNGEGMTTYEYGDIEIGPKRCHACRGEGHVICAYCQFDAVTITDEDVPLCATHLAQTQEDDRIQLDSDLEKCIEAITKGEHHGL